MIIAASTINYEVAVDMTKNACRLHIFWVQVHMLVLPVKLNLLPNNLGFLNFDRFLVLFLYCIPQLFHITLDLVEEINC